MKSRLFFSLSFLLLAVAPRPSQTANRLIHTAEGAAALFAPPPTKSVDVSSFGAACDGRTDDSNAFVRAEQAAGPGGKVYVRGGTCIAKVTLSTPGQFWQIDAPTVVKQPDGQAAYTLTITADHVTINGTGSIDGNLRNADASDCHFDCGAILVKDASNVTISGLTLQNSVAYDLNAKDTPYLTVEKTRGFNAGFHHYRLQITHPPSDGSDSIKGVQMVHNWVDTTGNPGKNKDSYQIIGAYINGVVYYYDGLSFSDNTSTLLPADPSTGGLGDRVEFGYLRNSTLANNTSKGGRLSVSVNASINVSITGNTATGISETCFEEVGNTSAVWTNNSCSDGKGKVFGGGLWQPLGIGSKNVTVNFLTGTNMAGGGVGLYYAINPTLSNLNLEAPANADFSKQDCIFLAWTSGAKISNLTCNGVAAGVSQGVHLFNSENVTVTGSRFNSLVSALTIKGDDRGPGGRPHAAFTPTAGGSLPGEATYYARVVALCPSGATVGLEGKATTREGGGTNAIDWAWAPVPCATSYQLWVGTTPGGEDSYFSSASHMFQQTVATGTRGRIPTSKPTSTDIGNVNLTGNHVNGVRSIVATDYSRGATGGRGIVIRNTVNDATGARYADNLDYTRNGPIR
jgi:hypothetical protein